jgi:methylmalonyl-CoA/ethylmalonyl-CoA epimerase
MPRRDGRYAVLTRIDHVGIACRDLETATAFYEATFGLRVVSRETNAEHGVRETI